jgi:hypothetical protein
MYGTLSNSVSLNATVESSYLRRYLCLKEISPLARPPAERGDQTFAANFGYGDFNFSSLGSSYEFLLEIAEAAGFILTDEFADVFAGRSPVSGGDLAFDVFLERFGERDVQRGHGHAFII